MIMGYSTRECRRASRDGPAEDQPYANDASLTAESLGYIDELDLMEDDTDMDFIDYPNEPGTDDEDPEDEDEDPEEDPNEEHDPEDEDEDPKEDPNEEHDPEDKDEDPEEDPSEEHEPKDEDAKEDEPFEDSDKTVPFEENETAATPPPPRSPQTRAPFSQTRLRRAWKTVRPEPPMPASMEEDFSTYLPPPPGCRCSRPEFLPAKLLRAPRRQYDFVDAVEAGQGLIRSPVHDARTITRAADREVNLRVSYQAQVHRQESKIFYTQLHDARTNRRDIRLEIDVVRGQRTSYEIELHERQRAEDDAVRQIMRTQVLEARARIDTVEDAGSSFIIIIFICIDIVIVSHAHCILVIIRIMPVTRQGTNDVMTPESIQAMIDQAIQRNSTQDDGSQSSMRRNQKMRGRLINGTKGVVGLSQWIKKIKSVFHISDCAIENQVKFATCTLLGDALT
ncbi:hypothetical protein Tco_0620014 [Tanacetum coccineum]